MSQMIKLPQQEMSVDALKALIAEAEAPRPIEGQIYRHVEDAEGKRTHRRKCNGLWEYQSHRAGKWHSGLNWDEEVAYGRLVPYTPPPPTFQVGQWIYTGGQVGKIKELPTGKPPYGDCYLVSYVHQSFDGLAKPSELRLATPDEIAAATRIQPKPNGLTILREKQTGNVYATNQWRLGGGTQHAVNFTTGEFCYLVTEELSTERYDLLSEFHVRTP